MSEDDAFADAKSKELMAAATEFMEAAATIGEQLVAGRLEETELRANFARCRAAMDQIERKYLND